MSQTIFTFLKTIAGVITRVLRLGDFCILGQPPPSTPHDLFYRHLGGILIANVAALVDPQGRVTRSAHTFWLKLYPTSQEKKSNMKILTPLTYGLRFFVGIPAQWLL